MAYRPILLVEDNPDDEVLTLRALRKNNVLNPVTVARDGAEALEILLGDRRDSEMSPGLILLDLKLPKIDGPDVLRRLRADERTRLLPVVILTASRQEEDILAGYRDGANAYVRKPVSFRLNSPTWSAPSASSGCCSANARPTSGCRLARSPGMGVLRWPAAKGRIHE